MVAQHGDGFTDSGREAVLEALAIEQRLKHEGKPYSEGVITACEVCLRVYARKPHLYQVPHEPPPKPPNFQPEKVKDFKPCPPREYWWNKNN